MLALNENNDGFRGLMGCDTEDYNRINMSSLYRTKYLIGYKVSFTKNRMGELVHFYYGCHNYYGKIIDQDPINQTFTLEALTEDDFNKAIEIEKEAFDAVI